MPNSHALVATNDLALRRTLEAAGVEFIDENGGGQRAALRNRIKPQIVSDPQSGRAKSAVLDAARHIN